MATANRTAPSKTRIRKPARRKPAHQPLPDLHGILDRFCCALSVVIVSQIAIGASDQMAARTASYGKGSPRSTPSMRNLTLPLARSPAPSLTEVRRESLSVGAAGSGREMASTG